MVSHGRRWISTLALALMFARAVAARDISDYRLGDRIEADVTTPFALKVVDMEASAALKEKEAMRVLVILRHDPSVLTDAEKDLRAAFSQTRSNFVWTLERYFKKRKLDAAVVASPEFELIRVTFQRWNQSFPVSTNLAAAWALGDSGRAEQAAVVDRLRAIMRQPIRDQKSTTRIKVTARARLVSVTDRDELLTPDSIGKRGKTIPRTNTIALDRARRDFIASFPPEAVAEAKFAATFLQPNCRIEEELTEALRARQTEALWVLTEYQPGETVARAGQLVDAKVLGALQAVQEKIAQVDLKNSVAAATREQQLAREQNRWLWIAGVTLAAALALVTWQWWRRRREASLLPMLAGESALATSPEAEAWRMRAVEAERRVERAHEALRAGVLTQVSSVLKEKLVQGLITQRKDLIEAQQAAATEMEALEKRLDDIQAPLQDRLLAYEARIGELEKALAAKDEQNRELIKAKIALVRKQLEAERAKGHALMN